LPRSAATAVRKAGMTSSADRWMPVRSFVTTMKVPVGVVLEHREVVSPLLTEHGEVDWAEGRGGRRLGERSELKVIP
jgi:hypothetical protein